MTKEQREHVFATGKEIAREKDGQHFKVYASESIVRIQDTKDNANYRMLVICKADTRKTIRTKMLDLFEEMRKGTTKKKK